MGVNVRGRSFLTLLDYTPDEIRYLLDLSVEFKNMKRNGVDNSWLKGCPSVRKDFNSYTLRF